MGQFDTETSRQRKAAERTGPVRQNTRPKQATEASRGTVGRRRGGGPEAERNNERRDAKDVGRPDADHADGGRSLAARTVHTAHAQVQLQFGRPLPASQRQGVSEGERVRVVDGQHRRQ